MHLSPQNKQFSWKQKDVDSDLLAFLGADSSISLVFLNDRNRLMC